jgi:hypothetical protein
VGRGWIEGLDDWTYVTNELSEKEFEVIGKEGSCQE